MKISSILLLFFLASYSFGAEEAKEAYQKAQEFEKSGDIQNALLWYKTSAELALKESTLSADTLQKVQEPLIQVGKNSVDGYDNNITNNSIKKIIFANFDVQPYKSNYLLPVTYDFHAKNDRKKSETKFQLSFKKQLAQDFLGMGEKLYLGYTQTSWWQTSENSAPFRETNYQPEFFIQFPYPYEKTALKAYTLGLVHESNGRSGENSRSWNRIYLEGIFQYKGIFIMPRAWYRIPESEKRFVNDTQGDDNPNIHNYLGYGDLKIAYPYKENLFTLTLRNNLRFEGENRGAVEFGWTFAIPWIKDLYGYLQYFHGYGESLIDYDKRIEKVGLGFAITR